jgi:hypothetical protein
MLLGGLGMVFGTFLEDVWAGFGNIFGTYFFCGFLEVLEFQIEGKKKMSSTEFINGYKNYNSTKLF